MHNSLTPSPRPVRRRQPCSADMQPCALLVMSRAHQSPDPMKESIPATLTRMCEPAAPGKRRMSQRERFMISDRYTARCNSSLEGEHPHPAKGLLVSYRQGKLPLCCPSSSGAFYSCQQPNPSRQQRCAMGQGWVPWASTKTWISPQPWVQLKLKHTVWRTKTLVSRARHRRTLLQHAEKGCSTLCLNHTAALGANTSRLCLLPAWSLLTAPHDLGKCLVLPCSVETALAQGLEDLLQGEPCLPVTLHL